MPLGITAVNPFFTTTNASPLSGRVYTAAFDLTSALSSNYPLSLWNNGQGTMIIYSAKSSSDVGVITCHLCPTSVNPAYATTIASLNRRSDQSGSANSIVTATNVSQSIPATVLEIVTLQQGSGFVEMLTNGSSYVATPGHGITLFSKIDLVARVHMSISWIEV